jgi:hypothetical protein
MLFFISTHDFNDALQAKPLNTSTLMVLNKFKAIKTVVIIKESSFS